MRYINKLSLIVASLCLSFAVNAKIEVPSISDLALHSPNKLQKIACSRSNSYFTRAHYEEVVIDDVFATKVLDRYLSFLDFTRSLLLQKEVTEIYDNKSAILRAVNFCELDYPFSLYNDLLKRRFEKYEYFLSRIKEKNLDLHSDKTIYLDRDKGPYAKDEEERLDRWDCELINELIVEILKGKTEDAAYERLQKRYESALTKLSQTTDDDVFSTFENAIASAIDPHTSYLSAQDSESFNDDINLSLEGIGAVLMSEDEYTVINSIIAGSPAEKSKKLKPKDKIIGVRQEDGTYDDILGWRLTDVVKKIKGPSGSEVTLDIEREEGARVKTFEVTLKREKIKLADREAKGEVKTIDGNNVGVISIKSFYQGLSQDIDRELTKLKQKNVKSIVLDLRSNGGGLLPEAIFSTGLFIKEGPVVLVRVAKGQSFAEYDEDSSSSYTGPLVVLINRLSASSSEIMAAALRDYGRAIIVGDTSFGKGTVQQSRTLERIYDNTIANKDLGSVHYTMAKFYRITGDSTQLHGVSPDITFPSFVDESIIGEKHEPNALEFDRIDALAPFEGYLDIDAYKKPLLQKHKKRVADNIFFTSLHTDMNRYLDFKKNNKYLSLNIDKRTKLKDEDEKYNLEQINKKLKAIGKDPIAKLDDLPEDFEFPDALLDEACNIANDFYIMQSEKLYPFKHQSLVLKR